MTVKNSVIVVIGPTSSGKSELAVKLAKRIDGEIISADSRQIYRGMDIGSGKVPGQWRIVGGRKIYIYKNVPHYLIDEASPRRQYTVARFQKRATEIIDEIHRRGKTPIICGGTAHWIDALVFGQRMPAVQPDAKLRAKLAKMSPAQMFAELAKLDPERAREIDAHNPRRLVRALEIVMTTGKPVPKLQRSEKYKVTWLGIKPESEILRSNIEKRLKSRLKAGMLAEVKKLRSSGLSWKRLVSFGLEYRFCALHLQGKISRAELEPLLLTAINQFTKRQMTWWKRNPAIKWSDDPISLQSALR